MVDQVIKQQKLILKTDGTVPSPGAVSLAARDFKLVKKKRGRRLGWKKTSKAEDKKLMQNFKRLRPPGSNRELGFRVQGLGFRVQGSGFRV